MTENGIRVSLKGVEFSRLSKKHLKLCDLNPEDYQYDFTNDVGLKLPGSEIIVTNIVGSKFGIVFIESTKASNSQYGFFNFVKTEDVYMVSIGTFDK